MIPTATSRGGSGTTTPDSVFKPSRADRSRSGAPGGTSLAQVVLLSHPVAPAGADPRQDITALEAVAEEFGLGPEIAVARSEMADAIEAGDHPTLRSLRLRAGLSQAELARALGTSQARVSTWETGREDLMLRTAARLASALGVDLNTLQAAVAGHG